MSGLSFHGNAARQGQGVGRVVVALTGGSGEDWGSMHKDILAALAQNYSSVDYADAQLIPTFLGNFFSPFRQMDGSVTLGDYISKVRHTVDLQSQVVFMTFNRLNFL